MDILKRGISADGTIRVYACITTELVNHAQQIHHTYPVATAALGRLLTGAAMMGASGLKSKEASVTLQIKGDGPLGFAVAVAEANAHVRGYVSNPCVDRPLNSEGKLDVGGAVGKGYLSVIRDLGLKEPYIGQIPLVSGEIAEDITMYYAQSEQTPTATGLGVLVDTDNSVLAAGGFLIQLMPGATDETACKLEKTLSDLPPVTSMIHDGIDIDDLIFKITDGFDMLIENKSEQPLYECKCSKERMENALISIGYDELSAIIDEQGEAELTCQFCDNKYTFSKEELIALLKSAKKIE